MYKNVIWPLFSGLKPIAQPAYDEEKKTTAEAKQKKLAHLLRTKME